MYKLRTHIGFTNLWSNVPRICVISSQSVKNGTRTPCKQAKLLLKFKLYEIVHQILVSIVVSIPACHAGDRGSIPRRGGHFFLAFLLLYCRNLFATIRKKESQSRSSFYCMYFCKILPNLA